MPKIREDYRTTPEQDELMSKNGIDRGLLAYRLNSGWTIEKAISTPPRSYMKFTEEQLEIMDQMGIQRSTASQRVRRYMKKGMSYDDAVEAAIHTQVKNRKQKTEGMEQ